MKKTRYFIAIFALCLGFGATRVQAQTEAQNLTFSIVGQYVTNITNVISTNAETGKTEIQQAVTTVMLDTANIAKAIAIDLYGTNCSNTFPSGSSSIVREVNMVTGTEAIFLRHGTNQVRISNITNDLYTNFLDFTLTNSEPGYAVTNFSPAATNPIQTNVTYEVTNFLPVPAVSNAILPIVGGWTYMYSNNPAAKDSNVVTAVDGLYSLSFTSYNIQFQIWGNGQGTVSRAGGGWDGTNYDVPTLSTEIIGAGTFNLNVSTNIFFNSNPTNPPVYCTGVAHGSVVVGTPYFLAIPGP